MTYFTYRRTLRQAALLLFIKIMQLIAPALTGRHTSKENWETDTGPQWLQRKWVSGSFKKWVSSNLNAATAFPKKGRRKRVLALLRAHVPSPVSGLKIDLTWNLPLVGKQLAQALCRPANSFWSFTGGNNLCKQWFEFPASIKYYSENGWMRRHNLLLWGAREWEEVAWEMFSYAIHCPSLCLGWRAAAFPAGQYEEEDWGRKDGVILSTNQKWILTKKRCQETQRQSPVTLSLSFSSIPCYNPLQILASCLKLHKQLLEARTYNITTGHHRAVSPSLWGIYPDGAGGASASLWQLKFASALCSVRAGIICLLVPRSRSAYLLKCSHFTKKAPPAF